MTLFRSREIVDAVQWSGSNWHEVLDFCGRDWVSTNGSDLFLKTIATDDHAPKVAKKTWIVKSKVHAFGFLKYQPAQFERLYERVPD